MVAEYLETMGIQIWQSRELARNNSHSRECENPEKCLKMMDSRLRGNDKFNWTELEQKVKACTLCELHKTRKNVVFGVGNKNADLLLIGEAPGATEDVQGKPFVGRAGQLLDAMLAAIGLHRDDVFIANILKCRPPNNRDPLPNEVKLCTPYLQQQIALIKPKVILAVGRIAAHFLLNTDQSMARLRGKLYKYGDQQIPLIVTYHPAYLLRSPQEKAKAYEDLLYIRHTLNIRGSDKG
jgi:DNA polymerase